MIYLLHFGEPLGDPDRPRMCARHYLGYTDPENLWQRIEDHRAGRGARITAAAARLGIRMELVAVWRDGDRNTERQMKNAGNHQRRCFVCNPTLATRFLQEMSRKTLPSAVL